MNQNDRYRLLRRKVKNSGRCSLTAIERIEWEQLSPTNRSAPEEGDMKELRSAIARLQETQEGIKKELRKLKQSSRRNTEL